MKKLTIIFLVLLLALAWSASVSALTLPPHFKMKMANLEFFNTNVVPGVGPFSDGIEDNWGIANITQIFDTDNPLAPAVWKEGDNGEHLRLIYWGLDITSWTSNPGPFTTGPANVTIGGTPIPYAGADLWLWKDNITGYTPVNITGGPGARSGYNNYPTISGSNGGLQASLQFFPGIDAAGSLTIGTTFGTGLPPTGHGSGYLDVIPMSGPLASTIDTDGFPTFFGNRDIHLEFDVRPHPDVNQPDYGWDLNSEDPVTGYAKIPSPCIDIEKEISVDSGTTWLDADTVDTAAKATAPHGALYRLIVRNCGNVPLIDVVINDPTLGITGYPVGNLAAGASVTLTSIQIPQLVQPNRCETPGEYKNTATVSGTDDSGTTVTDSDPAYLICTPPPCIDVEKEISVDNGTTWLDADTVDTAAKVTAPHGAIYRLIVRNCGNVGLTNVVVIDPTFGITYSVGNLAADASVTLTSVQIPQLDQPNRCETPGEYKNTATVSGKDANGTTVTDSDPAWLVCEQKPLACRVTAGGNKDYLPPYCPLLPNGMPDKQYCIADIYNTWGGQAGAQPRIDGNWTHHYFYGNKSKSVKEFVFHSNDLFWITCSDPGCCVPACANAKNRQIDFAGIGQFNNQKGYSPSLPTGDLCFTVHLEDIGEPGGSKTQKSAPCTHCPGTPISSSDCASCGDYYEIKIYDSATHDNAGHCIGNLLYKNGSVSTNCGPGDPQLEGYFSRAGNVQMHTDNNGP